jgi:hypothetical protein
MIEQERTKEDQREKELRECKDEKRRVDLEAQYGYQRADAQQRITQIMSRHKSELNRYTN